MSHDKLKHIGPLPEVGVCKTRQDASISDIYPEFLFTPSNSINLLNFVTTIPSSH